MCYTAEDSMNAFLIGVAGSMWLLWYTKSSTYSTYSKEWAVVALIFLFVSFMQLFDYLFWVTPCGSEANAVFTKVAVIWNQLQPIVFALLVWYILNRTLSVVSQLALFIYVVVATTYTVSHWSRIQKTCQTEVSGDALEWSWHYQAGAIWMYTVFLLTLLVIGYMELKGFARVAFLVWTFLLYVISFQKYQISQNIGRMWCYFAAFGPAIFTLLLMVEKRIGS